MTLEQAKAMMYQISSLKDLVSIWFGYRFDHHYAVIMATDENERTHSSLYREEWYERYNKGMEYFLACMDEESRDKWDELCEIYLGLDNIIERIEEEIKSV